MASTLAKVAVILGVGLGFAALVAYATRTKAYSGPANAGQVGGFGQGDYLQGGVVQNEETVEIERDAEGLIKKYSVHRRIEG